MADTKMAILSLMYLHNFMYIIDGLYTQQKYFYSFSTVFSKFIAVELLSERLRNK